MSRNSFLDLFNMQRKMITEGLEKGNEAQEKILQLESVSDYDIDYLIKLFAKGFTMQKDNRGIDLYTASYQQKHIDFDYWLSEENLDRLTKHCIQNKKYGGRIAEEHIIVECLIIKYREIEDRIEKQDKMIDLMAKKIFEDLLDENNKKTYGIDSKEDVKEMYMNILNVEL